MLPSDSTLRKEVEFLIKKDYQLAERYIFFNFSLKQELELED